MRRALLVLLFALPLNAQFMICHTKAEQCVPPETFTFPNVTVPPANQTVTFIREVMRGTAPYWEWGKGGVVVYQSQAFTPEVVRVARFAAASLAVEAEPIATLDGNVIRLNAPSGRITVQHLSPKTGGSVFTFWSGDITVPIHADAQVSILVDDRRVLPWTRIDALPKSSSRPRPIRTAAGKD